MELPTELFVEIAGYLPNTKAVVLASIFKNTPRIVLKGRQKFKSGWRYNFAVSKLKLFSVKLSAFDLSEFSSLRSLYIKKLDVDCSLELGVEKLHVGKVSSKTCKAVKTCEGFDAFAGVKTCEGFNIRLKHTRKLEVDKIKLNYFPFILNQGLQILDVTRPVENVPDTVTEYYVWPSEGIGKQNNTYIDDLSTLKSNTLCFPEHLTIINIWCTCPDFIVLPVNLKALAIKEYNSTGVKTIKFNEKIKIVNITCHALTSLVFPDTVKTLILNLNEATGQVIAPGVRNMGIYFTSWNIDSMVFPKYLEKLEFMAFNVSNLVLPETLKKLELHVTANIAGVKIPGNIRKLTLMYRDETIIPIHNLQKVTHLSLYNAPVPIAIPNVQKLLLNESLVEHLPDTVESLTLTEDRLPPNIPKSLRTIYVDIENVDNYILKMRELYDIHDIQVISVYLI